MTCFCDSLTPPELAEACVCPLCLQGPPGNQRTDSSAPGWSASQVEAAAYPEPVWKPQHWSLSSTQHHNHCSGAGCSLSGQETLDSETQESRDFTKEDSCHEPVDHCAAHRDHSHRAEPHRGGKHRHRESRHYTTTSAAYSGAATNSRTQKGLPGSGTRLGTAIRMFTSASDVPPFVLLGVGWFFVFWFFFGF